MKKRVLSEAEWREVFHVRRRSKRGERLTDADRDLLDAASKSDPKRYAALEGDVFDATVPFGSAARKPDECFYCGQRVGEPHGPSCVIVKKLVELKIEARLDGVAFSGLWQCEVPYAWDAGMTEFHKNESSWCASNFRHEENKGSVVWEGNEDRWPVLKAEHDKGGCLCEALSFTFVRIVDSHPRRDIRR